MRLVQTLGSVHGSLLYFADFFGGTLLYIPPMILLGPLSARVPFNQVAKVCLLLSGAWFVFRNRRGDRLKILWWDGTGYCLLYKRLETGTFPMPRLSEGVVKLSGAELSLLLEGIDWRRLATPAPTPSPQVAA